MKFIDPHHDRWHMVVGEDGPMPSPSPQPDRLLTLEQWHAVREAWPQGLATAVMFPNDHDIEVLEPDLPRLTMVALHFPKWVDGRSYSLARILRSRYRYTGEIRATGEVLVDMVPLLARTGFDAAVLRADQSRETAQRQLERFKAYYQGDVADNRPLFAR